jgi:hypothetical protein
MRPGERVGEEPEHVVFAVFEAFQEAAGGRLFLVAAGDAGNLGQAHDDAVAEQPQVPGCLLLRDGGQALVAGDVGGVDEGTQLVCDLDRPDGTGVVLGGGFQVAEQVGCAQLVGHAVEGVVVLVPVVDDDGAVQVAVDEGLERGQVPVAEEVAGEQARAGDVQVLLLRGLRAGPGPDRTGPGSRRRTRRGRG